MVKPKLRMVHNMARSGGTLTCKCIGCMEGVVLLSELHPMAWKLFNPIKQAEEWFGLVKQSDLRELHNKGGTTYAKAIALIDRRCKESGKTLVLRDWSHLDYTGYPLVSAPAYRPLLYAELTESFDILRISITRDPVTQWQSLARLGVMQGALRSGKFGVDKYLVGYRKYAELCVQTGFVRYEDFLRDAESEMKRICEHLEIRFDPAFSEKWPAYTTITGDINPNNPNKITERPRRPVDPSLKKRFLANPEYHRACELLGYETLR